MRDDLQDDDDDLLDPQEEDRQAQERYEKFRDSLSLPVMDRPYFDQDDLVEIFDTAGDNDDDYVRWEVLFHGAHFFADSPDLADRRAIMYDTLSDALRDGFLMDHASEATVITNILRLRSVNPSPKEARGLLDQLIEPLEDLDDEEVIQLCNVAVDLGAADWLTSREDAIKKRTQYPATLVYEMAMNAMDSSDEPQCQRRLEELTMLEPFNAEFWRLLAECHERQGDIPEALSALDYALAMDPEDTESRYIRCRLALATNDPASARLAVADLRRIRAASPEATDVVQTLAEYYVRVGDAKALAQLTGDAHPRMPDNALVTAYALLATPQDTAAILQRYANAVDSSFEAPWTELADAAAPLTPTGAIDALLYAEKGGRLSQGWERLMGLLYQERRWEDILRLHAAHHADAVYQAAQTPAMAIILAEALVYAGHPAEARTFADQWRHHAQEMMETATPAQRLTLKTACQYLTGIGK